MPFEGTLEAAMDAILAQLPQIEQMCQALYLAHVSVTAVERSSAEAFASWPFAACKSLTATIMRAE